MFTTIARHGHLQRIIHSPSTLLHWRSWSKALFESLLQAPANRIGYTARSLTNAKILIFKA
ncbi:DMT family protein [Candidatus Nitrotoga sp. M5]|uniref:DMT family protein n=1 Tax=Candidatus Nitrotoga sp. M5 TaxID=2890409 RepID=UPI00403D5FB0